MDKFAVHFAPWSRYGGDKRQRFQCMTGWDHRSLKADGAAGEFRIELCEKLQGTVDPSVARLLFWAGWAGMRCPVVRFRGCRGFPLGPRLWHRSSPDGGLWRLTLRKHFPQSIGGQAAGPAR